MTTESVPITSVPYDTPQAFRRVYRNPNPGLDKMSDEIIYIKPQFDPECGVYVIFWDDILNTFEDAITYKISKSSALFVKGIDNKIKYPLRFNTFIRVVLDIIIENPVDSLTNLPSQSLDKGTSPSSTNRNPFLYPRSIDGTEPEDHLQDMDSTRGIGLTLKKAIDGDTQSQNDIGSIYSSFHMNYDKAFEWNLKAANKGNHVAQYTIGYYYLTGLVVRQSYKIAKEWFEKAVVGGYSSAQCGIGTLHHDGHEYPKDPNLALEWYLKADAQGCSVSPMNIGLLYKNELKSKDISKTIEWFTKAAERGNPTAQIELGDLYRSGYGRETLISNDKAEEWYLLAAHQGSRKAQELLYAFYKNIKKDESLSLKWKLIGANQGSASMQFNMGVMYFKGSGVPVDYIKAIPWFRLARENGTSSYDYNYLSYIYRWGLGVPQDFRMARDLQPCTKYYGYLNDPKELRRKEKKKWTV